ncbi:hypothetical protein AVEN_200446-1 [Araneus ventricosus]|uniref:Uncharacterized protein n=1 Tax=Araneus ventricosus TaxID=182803 RepID=A0A4Y2TIF4_ARAVE|nr:hypothetical protein AVEN_130286-1 [Araneus ventricosus]GBN99810.1 hypothetical protein AVEN_200446-1 [Araneus ventricosus]
METYLRTQDKETLHQQSSTTVTVGFNDILSVVMGPSCFHQEVRSEAGCTGVLCVRLTCPDIVDGTHFPTVCIRFVSGLAMDSVRSASIFCLFLMVVEYVFLKDGKSVLGAKVTDPATVSRIPLESGLT